MHIGLYFGSFNPIHVGHLIIASHAVNTTDLDEVWFVVSPQNPFKLSNTLLNERHRLNLVRAAIEDAPGLKASNVEFKLPRPSYTVDTLAYLHEKYPKYIFSILLGSDGFANLENWKNAAALVKSCKFYIYGRPNFPVKNTLNADVEKLNGPLLEISSTSIRNLIKQRKSIRYMVTDPVRNEIEKNGFYSSSLENPAE